MLRRLRALTENECYWRCYGSGHDSVRVISVERRRRPPDSRLDGEQLRRSFERRLDVRGPEAELAA